MVSKHSRNVERTTDENVGTGQERETIDIYENVLPKISIIIPVYNVAMYLSECLESVLNQTFKELEVICVNDGSTDASPDILKKYAEKDSRIRIISKANSGYGDSMNCGIDEARGKYVGIVEPDDFVMPRMYETLYRDMEQYNLDMIKSDFYRFTGEIRINHITGDIQGKGKVSLVRLDETGSHYHKVICPSKEPEVSLYPLNTWSGIYRREFLNTHNIRHNVTSGASFQDNGFYWQTIMFAKRCMFLDRPFYMNRRDNPGSSVKSKGKVYCMNIEYDFIREIFMRKENRGLWRIFRSYYNIKRYENYKFTLSRIDRQYWKEYVDRISREFCRSLDLNEIDLTIFDHKAKNNFLMLVRNPRLFYYKYALYDDIMKIKKFCLLNTKITPN